MQRTVFLFAVFLFISGCGSTGPLDRYTCCRQQPFGTPTKPGELRVTFLGNSTLFFSDGEEHLLIDGFISRPGLLQFVFGHIEPDQGRIHAMLERLDIEERSLKAVIPVHSHYDHVLDAGEVAKRTGALLVGSPSTLTVGSWSELPRSQMRNVAENPKLTIGNYQLTFIKSKHAPAGPLRQFFGGKLGAKIDAHSRPPLRAGCYHEGVSYSVLIEHGTQRILVHASAGFAEDALAHPDYQADVVFLGIGGLGQASPAYKRMYFRETVEAVNATTIVPVHWDNFMRPETPGLKPFTPLFDNFHGAMGFLVEQADTSPNRTLIILDSWEQLNLSRLSGRD